MTPKTIVSVLESLSATDVALTRGLTLAQWYGAKLHVIAVGAAADVDASDAGAAYGEFVEWVADLSGNAGVAVTPAALSGNPVRAAADYTHLVSADLLVVEKRARRSNGYWSAGSFATALGKEVTSPTLAISRDAAQVEEPGIPFRHVLSAVDFSVASLRAMSEAVALVRQSRGQLRLLHVLNGFPYETVYSGSHALRLMDDLGVRVARVNRQLASLIPPDALTGSAIDVATVSGESHRAILAAAAERRTDLIVLGLPRRTRLEELVAGSTVHRVLRRATSPVLLVPGPPTVRLVNPEDEYNRRIVRYPSEDDVRAVEPAVAGVDRRPHGDVYSQWR